MPGFEISTDTRCPTRCPHREQNRSTPFVYVAPHWPQFEASVIVEIRPPQCPQNGRPAETIFPQRWQVASETRVCWAPGSLLPGPTAADTRVAATGVPTD